ncbi:hypothetical protein ABB37_05953 [Leptomonas pyrrhocoris]|uniref:Uncharacterized protein n=1 Tax=Leptomonas pyrrhocoris TaxID=157538 RepID=A0A0M9FZ47_LEPPY|nr:hypothetical protein ABB37_05953 [Leptomonas pyrrhocoris]KPA78889.1 hypothetical protein ABB37_05953 [Leptomonas pyrrhocoris]|eukprot:XP_015657328.1 hypothetical protein ABB37_05953 [Leptomonas pyrrhocoris]
MTYWRCCCTQTEGERTQIRPGSSLLKRPTSSDAVSRQRFLLQSETTKQGELPAKLYSLHKSIKSGSQTAPHRYQHRFLSLRITTKLFFFLFFQLIEGAQTPLFSSFYQRHTFSCCPCCASLIGNKNVSAVLRRRWSRVLFFNVAPMSWLSVSLRCAA